ncbi:MAG TPA: T9SS type A sorting domain-containing protein, partial [Flavobacterium sp.]
YYKILFRNKGNVQQSGDITFTFEDDVIDFVSASQPAAQNLNVLSWTYSNLNPFETRTIDLVMHLNAPTSTPPLVTGQQLAFEAIITPLSPEEVPADNVFAFKQTVVNSVDPNDKTCLEGDVVGPDMIGNYAHYIIRFENTGTAEALNIVVSDLIDTSKFDVSTLIPLDGSHPFETRISSTNKVEFIFENIMLPFEDATNDGYVAFKIKTLPTLAVGDTFSNSASIYFDYNFPIVTNTATTAIQQLGTGDFEFSDHFTLYPNPAKNTLNIKSQPAVEIFSVGIYNTLGQLVLVLTEPIKVSGIDVSDLKSGSYFLKMDTSIGSAISRFIKE